MAAGRFLVFEIFGGLPYARLSLPVSVTMPRAPVQPGRASHRMRDLNRDGEIQSPGGVLLTSTSFRTELDTAQSGDGVITRKCLKRFWWTW